MVIWENILNRIKNKELYILIMPTIILFFVFLYIPMAGLIVGFRKYDVVSGLFGSEWVGLKYFKQFFNDPYFFRILRNTVVLNFNMLIFTFPAPIILALFINEIRQKKVKRLFQSVSYLPHFIATVVIVGLMKEVLSGQGLVNQILEVFGIERQLFFNDVNWFRPMYIGSSIWEGTGWAAIIYLAALTGINPELYESASIEGANRWQKIRFITIPGLLPTIIILLILRFGSIMSVGIEKVFLMYNPGTYETADVITTYVYRRGILNMDYSYATAVGIFNAVINFCLLLTANKISKKSGNNLW